MSGVGSSPWLVRLRRSFWVDDRPMSDPSKVRAFLGRYFWLFLVLASLVGLGCGLAAEFQIFKRNEHPAVSFGLFVVAPALFGWLALRPSRGAVVGLLAMLAVTLGHFAGAQFTEYDQNNLEYRGWLFIAVILGPLLGFAGHKIRSRRMVTRSLATSVPITLICIPLYLWHAGTSYFLDYFDPSSAVFDVASALLFLLLCRGIVARVFVLPFSLAISYPFLLGVLISFPFLWYSGGGI